MSQWPIAKATTSPGHAGDVAGVRAGVEEVQARAARRLLPQSPVGPSPQGRVTDVLERAISG